MKEEIFTLIKEGVIFFVVPNLPENKDSFLSTRKKKGNFPQRFFSAEKKTHLSTQRICQIPKADKNQTPICQCYFVLKKKKSFNKLTAEDTQNILYPNLKNKRLFSTRVEKERDSKFYWSNKCNKRERIDSKELYCSIKCKYRKLLESPCISNFHNPISIN